MSDVGRRSVGAGPGSPRHRESQPLEGVCSEVEFRAILERERARADRNNHGFSVAVFRVQEGAGEGDSSPLAQYVADLVGGQLRVSDEVGWFDEGRIGVLLYNTDALGAEVYVRRVRGLWESPCRVPDCVVYTYPKDWQQTGQGAAGKSDGAAGSARPEGAGQAPLECEACSASIPPPVQDATPPADPGMSCGHGLGLERFFARRLPWWKRVLDVALSGLGLILLSPLLVGVGLAVKATSRGPVLFRQMRMGHGGQPFTLYKFRSMVVEAESLKAPLLAFNERSGPAFKMREDPRVTPVGHFIRAWSLDELPQLFNVLRGDMSLVGPRPLPVEEAQQQEVWQNRRLELTPGITGLWQVSAREDTSFDRWARLDLEYAEKQSPLFDLKILAMTIPAVLSRRGAH